ncbi:hypothetical protein BYT27DRAFT_7250353 [Phlegmacium glaucopus]|nr:hypothetical protein BYT27DRAFT_7250353 [Phlegmacium glaucopus]
MVHSLHVLGGECFSYHIHIFVSSIYINIACDENVTRLLSKPNLGVNQWSPRSPTNFSGSHSLASSRP